MISKILASVLLISSSNCFADGIVEGKVTVSTNNTGKAWNLAIRGAAAKTLFHSMSPSSETNATDFPDGSVRVRGMDKEGLHCFKATEKTGVSYVCNEYVY